MVIFHSNFFIYLYYILQLCVLLLKMCCSGIFGRICVFHPEMEKWSLMLMLVLKLHSHLMRFECQGHPVSMLIQWTDANRSPAVQFEDKAWCGGLAAACFRHDSMLWCFQSSNIWILAKNLCYVNLSGTQFWPLSMTMGQKLIATICTPPELYNIFFSYL